MKQLAKVTLEAVKTVAGRTWFNITDECDDISLSTRAHGCVGSETAGKVDIAEGKRLMPLIKQGFPPSRFLVVFDVVDEWVSITIRKDPLTPREKLMAAQKKSRRKINDKVSKIAADLKAQGYAPAILYCDSGYQAEGHLYRTARLHLVIPFGEVVTALYTSFRYKTAEQAEEAARVIIPLITGLPLAEWKMDEVKPLYSRTALNGSGRILDKSSEVRFTAVFNIK